MIAPADGSALALFSQLAGTTTLDYSPLLVAPRLRDKTVFALRFGRETARFYAHLRRTRPDLVLVVTSVVPSALIAARAAGIPTIVYAAEMLHRRGLRRLGSRAVRQVVESAATAIVCVSDSVRGRFSARANAFTVYPAIDRHRVATPSGALRNRLGGQRGHPCLAILGNVARGRAHEVAVRALVLLDDLPDAWLLVAGAVLPRADDIAYERELRRLVSDLALEDRVVFAGFVDPVADAFELADIVVNLKRGGEGLGFTTLEALALGKPVVSTAGGGLTEVLAHESNALLIRDDDTEALAEAVLRLCREPALRERLVAQGRDDVAGAFSEEASVREFLRVVDSVLAGRG